MPSELNIVGWNSIPIEQHKFTEISNFDTKHNVKLGYIWL